MLLLNNIKKLIKRVAFFRYLNSVRKANQTVDWTKLNKNIIPTSKKDYEYRVLMATGTGHYQMGVLLESSLASALKQK